MVAGGKWANKHRDCFSINTTSADSVPKSGGLSLRSPQVVEAVPVNSSMSNGYDVCVSSPEVNGSSDGDALGDSKPVVPDQRSHVTVLPDRGVVPKPHDEGTYQYTYRCKNVFTLFILLKK